MTSILFLVETIYCNIFKCSYLRNKSPLLKHFPKKKWLLELMYFVTYGLRKTWLDHFLKNPISEDPSTSNIANGLKHRWKLNESKFAIFIDHC